MNKVFVFTAFVMALLSCSANKGGDDAARWQDGATEWYVYKDSCEHLTVEIGVELPVDGDSAASMMRDSLIAEFVRGVEASGCSEGQMAIGPYRGGDDDIQGLVDYYGKECYGRLLAMAKADYDDRMAYLEEDTAMTVEEKERIKGDVPVWAFDLKVKKVCEAPAFVVYRSETYSYYGGAHGGVGGAGAITFDRESGRKVSRFLREDATIALQPMIRKGLLRYYGEAGEKITDAELSDRLQMEGDVVPQPVMVPCPNASGDSLLFTYMQYEIACYADGMPSFSLPVSDLMPFMTPEGKALLEKGNAAGK